MAHQIGGGVDRLSALPDNILGHILSFLPTAKEAGQAAVLSTRFRYVFGHVHTLSFQAVKKYDFWSDTITFYLDSTERRSTNGGFLDTVNAALLAHRRCARNTPPSPLRVFRVAFHDYQHWDKDMVSMWVSHALEESEHELHLDLRFQTYQRCHLGDGRPSEDKDENDGGLRDAGEEEDDGLMSEDTFEENDGLREDGFTSDEEDKDVCIDYEQLRRRWSSSFPRPLFASALLRSLRLSHGRLDPPAAIALPSLETLHLTDVVGSEETTIQRLISSCPHLADLTLESCSKLTTVSLLHNKRLRRLALLCCHSVVTVSLDASELRSLHYRGAVPQHQGSSLFAFHGGSPRIIPSSTIKFCGPNQSSDKDLAGFRSLLENLEAAKHLHLNFQCIVRHPTPITKIIVHNATGSLIAMDIVFLIFSYTYDSKQN